MNGNEIPEAPPGLGSTATRVWRRVLEDYELADHELALLREIVRTVQQLEDLDEEIRTHGTVVEATTTGGRKPNPALVEARQQRIALARLLVALRVPLGDQVDDSEGEPAGDDGDDEKRPQRRGTRGVYQFPGAAS